jgi:ketosteroid isomerase-like protein
MTPNPSLPSGIKELIMRMSPFLGAVLVLFSCSAAEYRCTTGSSATEQVRRELEQAYAANEAAFAARDLEAVMKLRHPDFHTVDHTGKLSTRQDMHERTRLLLDRIERFVTQRETIRALELHGDTAIVTVFQETSRVQRLGDGALHTIDTSVTQREWWRCTTEGWRLWRVDEVEEGTLLIDGKTPT